MAEAWQPPSGGEDGQPFRPFDREALQATLADALKQADAADMADQDSAAPGAAGADEAPGRPTPLRPPMPFGRPTASSDPLSGAAQVPPPGPGPVPGGPAPRPAGVTPPARTGPSILSGGISAMASSASAGGVGSGTISPLRPPSGGGLSSPGMGGGLSSPGLSSPGLGGLGSSGLGSPTIDPQAAESTPTIPIRRPNRSEPPAPEVRSEEVQAAPAAPPPPRPTVTLVAWNPSDDDILPRSMAKRRRRG